MRIESRLSQSFSGWIATARDFGSFVLRPRLKASKDGALGAKALIAFHLFALSILLTMALGTMAIPLLILSDEMHSATPNVGLEGEALTLVVSIVILGPLVEELMFRGWLSGSIRAVAATAIALTAIFVATHLADNWLGGGPGIKQVVALVSGAAILWFLRALKRGPQLPYYPSVFPLLFWLQSLLFGVLHFTNYAALPAPLALLATLPLVACGLIWGYARIRLGLEWAVLLHAAYNVPAVVGLIFLA